MSTAIAVQNPNLAVVADDPIMKDAALWRVVSSGDLSALTNEQKSAYYLFRCRQEGLNPASQPFVYMKQQGKEILYGGKTAADQLRKIHGITLKITDQSMNEDVWVVTVEASMPDGRTETDIGAVTIGGLKGDARANALMKAITKAKRRVTYAICGTGVLDETELETIPGVQRMESPAPAPDAPTGHVARPAAMPETVEQETGEIQPDDAFALKTIRSETALLAKELKLDAKAVQSYAKTINADYRTLEGATALRDGLERMVDVQADQDEDEEDYEGLEAEQGTLLEAEYKTRKDWD